jgi:hypothetical protein
MSDELVVCAYNVLFGDGILVQFPDDGVMRSVVIDIGNFKGADKPLVDAVDDIIARTGGHIDLYVMTHEHLDHVQGLLAASRKGKKPKIDHIWMTASAAPDYYKKHRKAERKKRELRNAALALGRALGPKNMDKSLAYLYALNTASTDDCVKHIRKASGRRKPHYVSRASALRGKYPFKEAKVRILAPEQDTSVYFEANAPRLAFAGEGEEVGDAVTALPLPLPGIDGKSFYDLIEQMNAGLGETLFAIDKAENDTSLVVELEWRGRRLLFTGDAELKSWRMMSEKGVLQPVDLLKVGHHGSWNATPPPAILEEVLPVRRRQKAVAVVSTCNGVYPSVPDTNMKRTYSVRTRQLFDTRDAKPGKPIVIKLSPGR